MYLLLKLKNKKPTIEGKREIQRKSKKAKAQQCYNARSEIQKERKKKNTTFWSMEACCGRIFNPFVCWWFSVYSFVFFCCCCCYFLLFFGFHCGSVLLHLHSSTEFLAHSIFFSFHKMHKPNQTQTKRKQSQNEVDSFNKQPHAIESRLIQNVIKIWWILNTHTNFDLAEMQTIWNIDGTNTVRYCDYVQSVAL